MSFLLKTVSYIQLHLSHIMNIDYFKDTNPLIINHYISNYAQHNSDSKCRNLCGFLLTQPAVDDRDGAVELLDGLAVLEQTVMTQAHLVVRLSQQTAVSVQVL